MNEAAWQEVNNAYLAASLRWLRLRLRMAIKAEAPGPGRGEPGGFWQFLSPSAPAAPAPDVPPLCDEERKAAAEREAAAGVEPPPALVVLARTYGLSTFERDILLLCAALEFDPSFASLCGAVHANASMSYPTFGLALRAFENAGWEALAPHRPLRHEHLIEINQPGSTPLVASALRADERIVNYLKGLNVLDDRLAALVTPIPPGGDDLAESQQTLVETILGRLHDMVQQGQAPVVQLLGADAGSKLAVARQVAAVLDREVYRIAADALPRHASEVETLARLWQRESALLPVALYVEMDGVESASPDVQASFQRFLMRGTGLVFVSAGESPVRLLAPSFAIETPRPLPAEQFDAWVRVFGQPTAVTLDAASALSGQFNLNLAEIHEYGVHARRDAGPDGPLADTAWRLCCERTRPRLDALAQRLDVKATWDDLVLAEEQTNLMRQIAGQVRGRHKVYGEWGFARAMNRGFGISALFAGESGTGKTMAAEVIANDLKLNLYRIDLSAVVSKYIGETEKNLRRLFDAAEQGGAILFFDEADALFGKRSEVKDSHDRYANIEINYLLQRMEAFQGLAILATNMKAALDQAFLRRLRFVVTFQFPGIQERRRIWQKALPVEVPVNGLDYDRLAKLNVSGGNIHSIAINAAFLAAQERKPVTMTTVMAAARAEMRKLDRPINEAELRV